MRHILPSCLAVLAAAALSGCLTFPRSPEGTSMASYVGDRNTVELGTAVAPVLLAGEEASYVNLNVSLAVLIDTRKVALFSDTRDVREIVRRHEPRLSARVVELLSGASISEPSEIGKLRAMIAEETQAEFEAVFKQWSDAPKYDVRIVVTGLYLTSLDVTPTVPARTWWY